MLIRFSCVRLFATPWTVAHQAPVSMGFSRQEYWHGLPFPPPGDLPDPVGAPWGSGSQAGAQVTLGWVGKVPWKTAWQPTPCSHHLH